MEDFNDIEEPESWTKEVTVGNRSFTIKGDGQYGLWSITPKKGAVPKALSGKYTSKASAEQDIVRYANGHSST